VTKHGDILGEVLDAARDAKPIDGLDTWWQRYAPLIASHARPIDRALVAGAMADRLGYAFASGYQSALGSLFGAPTASAMLVTESGGGHPRAMHCTLTPKGDGFVLEGEKRFATLGTFAQVLYVLVKEGERDGLPRLRVAVVPRARAGVVVEPMPETPFCPEIPHAVTRFAEVYVSASEVLPGDGYADHVKPFRTVEDLHVFAAVLGHAIREARRSSAAPELVERLLALASMVRGLDDVSRASSATALALEGALVIVREALATMPEVLAHDAEALARWQRDQPIFRVANSARASRTEKARAAIGGTT
jgi:acyl-CoA dehydrogenase